MLALPLVCSFVVALLIAPAACATLAAGPLARPNYRGKLTAAPLGVVVVVAALCALGPLALAQQLSRRAIIEPELAWIAPFVLGVALLGLVDDALGGGPDAARGWRGHLAQLRRGRLDTGVLKAAGTLGLALAAMLARGGGGTERFLLGAGVLVLATHAFNLVDLRPGRAVKAFVALGVVLALASGTVRPLWAIGLFAGPVLAVGFHDLREHGMLGDTGASAVGALAGVWLVLVARPAA